ncbi:MAG: hypothetical protein ACO3FN_05790 [Vulcanococcus sp.]
MDPDQWGLRSLELEIWRGLLFLRFEPGPQPGVADLMARHEEELR